MAYGRKSPQHETVQLRDEITREVNTDAEHLAEQVFGEVTDMPDVGRVPNERLDAVYRRAYERGDRAWLQAEARRDPVQFERVTDRLGVTIPPPRSQPSPQPPQPLQLAQPQPPVMGNILGGGAGQPVAGGMPVGPMPLGAPSPSVPLALPMPVVPPPMVPVSPVSPRPVILGPNGQALT